MLHLLVLSALAVATLLLPAPAAAEVTNVNAGGFSVKHAITTAADPATVYKTMVNSIGEWWHPDHTWSGDPANLYIEAELGGCMCEKLPPDETGAAGGAEHLRIVYLDPNHEIRFDGSLGPLMHMAVQGRMSWRIEPVPEGSTVTFTYQVHGWMDGGFEGLAPAVDEVIGQQLQRLGQRLAPR